jgi:hypothetical protein
VAYAENVDRLLVFGGTLLDSEGQLAEMSGEFWGYDPSANAWDRLHSGATQPPSARIASLMGYDAKAGKVLLFGGREVGEDLNDTWVYDPVAATWTELHPATSPPGGRQYGGMVYDSHAKRLLLLSLVEDGDESPEVWSFDFAANAWSKLKTIDETPPSRQYPSVLWAEDIRLLLMIGGVAPEGAANDVWLFDPTSGDWMQQARLPKALIGDVSLGTGQMAAYDSAGKRAILCTTQRAADSEIYTFKTFSLSMATGEWADLQPAGATPPTLLKVASLTYDSKNGSLILYGGVTGSETYVQNRDVWVFAPPQQSEPVVKISVLSSGTVLVDGSPVSVSELDAKLGTIEKENGVVWYYRENPSGEPPPVAKAVLDIVVAHRLPVKLFSQPDFDPSSVVVP